MSLYASKLVALANEAAEVNEDALAQAAAMMAETVENGGLIHLYGSGHSVLPAQETFPRYGSYIAFHPLTDPRLMWHSVLAAGGVRELLWLERTEGYAEKFLDHQPINEGDTLIVFGHSGTNASGIDTALYCKNRGVKVIAVNTSFTRSRPEQALLRQVPGRRRRRRHRHPRPGRGRHCRDRGLDPSGWGLVDDPRHDPDA